MNQSIMILRAIARNLNNLVDDLDKIEEETKAEKLAEAPEKKLHELDVLYASGEMSCRTYNCLRMGYAVKHGGACIKNLEDLADTTALEVAGYRNIGLRSFREIKGLCEKYGVVFKGDPEDQL